MEAGRRFIKSQHLATHFVKLEVSERVIECRYSKTPPVTLGGPWSRIEPPIRDGFATHLTELDEAQWARIDLKNQEMLTPILRCPLEPALMFFHRDFMLGVHVTANIWMIAPSKDLIDIILSHQAYTIVASW